MQNFLNSSFFVLLGSVIGFLVKTWLDLRSQNIQQDCFYSEYFCKIRAERIIKFLDTFTLLKYHLINTEFVDPKETQKLLYEVRNSILSLHCIIDKENYKKLADLDRNLNKAIETRKEEDLGIFNNSSDLCFNIIEEYLPKDYLFKKSS